MLPAVRERLDFLGEEYERLVAENSRLQHLLKQSEFPSLDTPETDLLNKIAPSQNSVDLGPKEAWTQAQHARKRPEFIPSKISKDVVTCEEVGPATVAGSILKREDSFVGTDGNGKAVLQTFGITPAPGGSEQAPSAPSKDPSRAGDDPEESVSQLIFLDVIPAVIISINAVVVGLSADICPDHTVWVILEIFFTAFFTLEVIVKMKVFSIREFLCGPDWYWSWFDLFCVGLAYLEMCMSLPSSGLGTTDCRAGESEGGAGFGALKMLKLARLGRIVRLLKFKIFVELKLMIQGVFTGLRVLFWAVILLCACIYLLGVVCKTLLSQYEEFSTVPAAMFTSFRCFTDGCSAYDGTPLQERIRKEVGGIWMTAYILVFLFITIGIFNLIMAVFIDNVNDGSVKKKQYTLGMTADKTELNLADKLKGMCFNSGVVKRQDLEDDLEEEPRFTDGQDFEGRCNRIKRAMGRSGCIITKRTFNSWLLHNNELLESLDDAEIDTSSKFELFDVLDIDLSGKLPFRETVEGLMKCRGPVSKTDIISIRLRVRYLTRLVQQIHKKLDCPAAMM